MTIENLDNYRDTTVQAINAANSAAAALELSKVSVADSEDASFWGSGTLEPIPTPAIFRTSLTPYEFNINHIGLIGSNLLANAQHNRETLQDLIDWLGAKDVAGSTINSGKTYAYSTLVGSSFDPEYAQPVYALDSRSYTDNDGNAIDVALVLHPRVNLDFDMSVRFRAAEAMDAMLFGKDNFSLGVIQGGFWDAGGNSEHCWWFEQFGQVWFGNKQTVLYNPVRSALRLGYDGSDDLFKQAAYVDGINFLRPNSLYGSSLVAAIEVDDVSDSVFSNMDIIGYPVGIYGKPYISRAYNLHVWSWGLQKVGGTNGSTIGVPGYTFDPAANGPLKYGFHLLGGQMTFDNCQIDNPYLAAVRIVPDSATIENTFNSLSVTYADEGVTGNTPTTNTIPVFDLVDTSVVNVVALRENDQASFQFSGLVGSGDITTGLTGWGQARYRNSSEKWFYHKGSQVVTNDDGGTVADWTFRISDSSGNNSVTSVTGKVFVQGDIVMVTGQALSNISTNGLTSSDPVRINLPYAVRAQMSAVGGIDIQALNTVAGSSVQIMPVALSGTSYVVLRMVGLDTGSSSNLLVSEINTGVSDIQYFTLWYVKA